MVKKISQFKLFKRLIKVAFPQDCLELDFMRSSDGFTFYASICYKKLDFISSDLIKQAIKFQMDYSDAEGIVIDFYVHSSNLWTTLVIFESFNHD